MIAPNVALMDFTFVLMAVMLVNVAAPKERVLVVTPAKPDDTTEPAQEGASYAVKVTLEAESVVTTFEVASYALITGCVEKAVSVFGVVGAG